MNSLIFLRNSLQRRVAVANSIQFLILPRSISSSSNHGGGGGLVGAEVYRKSPSPLPPPSWINGGFREIIRRNFHVSAPSAVSGFANAVAPDYSDEDSKSSSNSDGLEISKLGIAREIVDALAKKGITKLFPIQRAVLEPAMQGRDMIGRARTGTGKTLAFGIPIMDKISQWNAKHGRGRNPLALVMAPTRELARQVDKEFYESAPHLDTLCVYGGVPISRQMSTLDRGVDVIVGTPGRIMDLIKRGALNLSEVQFVVLDEADQMLSVGFVDDVETILKDLPKKRQSMMFSATMPRWIIDLTQRFLKNPVTVDLVGDSQQKLADGIMLYSIASEVHEKPAIIGQLITEYAKGGKSIVFTQTKRDADRLANSLQRSLKCEALHGDISQNQRERTLAGFRDGRFSVLVATDVAARGLDVPNVDLVIHFELPNSSEIFVHRSGRTGRAGKKGSAILIYSSQQWRDVKGIERDVGSKFEELPKITVEAGAVDMFSSGFGGSGGRFGGSGGRYGGSGGFSGRYGGSQGGGFGSYGGSSYGRSSGGYGGSQSGGFGSYGGSSGRSNGGFGERSESGGFGSYGGSSGRSSGGFGERSESGGFGSYGGSSGRSSGGFGERSGGYGSSTGRSSGFGNVGGGGRSSGFGDFTSDDRSSGFGNNTRSSPSRSSGFGGFGEDKDGSNQKW